MVLVLDRFRKETVGDELGDGELGDAEDLAGLDTADPRTGRGSSVGMAWSLSVLGWVPAQWWELRIALSGGTHRRPIGSSVSAPSREPVMVTLIVVLAVVIGSIHWGGRWLSKHFGDMV